MLGKISVVIGCEFLIENEALGSKLTSSVGSSTAARSYNLPHKQAVNLVRIVCSLVVGSQYIMSAIGYLLSLNNT